MPPSSRSQGPPPKPPMSPGSTPRGPVVPVPPTHSTPAGGQGRGPNPPVVFPPGVKSSPTPPSTTSQLNPNPQQPPAKPPLNPKGGPQGPPQPPGGGKGPLPNPPPPGGNPDPLDWESGGGKGGRGLKRNESTREADLARAAKERLAVERELARGQREQLKAQEELLGSIDSLAGHFGNLGKIVGGAAKLSVLERDGKGSKGGKGGGLTGLGGGLEALAGKAAIAGEIVSAAKGLIQGVFDGIAGGLDMLKAGIEGAGKVAQKLAANDGVGALTTAVDTAADAIGAIPIVGGVFASGLKLASGSLNVFKGVIDSLGDRARELSKLNPALSQTVAEIDIQKFFADLDEANRNQEEYRALLIEQARADREWQKAITEIKKELLPWTTKMAKLMTILARAAPELVDVFLSVVGELVPGGKAIGAVVTKMLDAVALIEKNTRPDETPKVTPGLEAINRFVKFGTNIPQGPLDAPDRAGPPPILNQPFKGK